MRPFLKGSLSLTALIVLGTAPAFAACASMPAGSPTPIGANLLGENPAGGGQLSTAVRNLVASDPTQAAPIAALVASANPAQTQALGAGLGQASVVCTRAEPESARRIQEAVIGQNNPALVRAFQNVTGDRQTTAIGGGAGGAGGGLGGGGTGSGASSPGSSGVSPYIPPSTASYANSGLSFSAGSGIAPTTSTSTPSGAATISTAGTTLATSGATAPVSGLTAAVSSFTTATSRSR